LSGVVKLRLEYQNTFGETCKSENVLELAGLNRAV
jgi:integral membrane protein